MARRLITDPNLHDGYLNSLVLTKGGLSIGCSTVDGTTYELSLSKVERLRADDFREGNIIFSVETFVGADCPEDLVLEVFGPGADPSRPWFVDVMERIRREGWTFVSIDSSYGCVLKALAKGPLEIHRIG